jgi:predicted Rossmann fold flavoprotein
MSVHKIVIVGGGAAGFFAAINAAENAKAQNKTVDIQILEASEQVLKKVRISGGGRCNVTHNQFDVRLFCQNYPRGSKELLSAMQQFQARDTVDWFLKRGVKLVAEEDGRMFPDTNDSETVIECFLKEARRLGVTVSMGHSVTSIEKKTPSGFMVNASNKGSILADAILIATGASQAGYKLAKSLGHTITELAPSLFSFKISDRLLVDLSGLSFPNCETKLTIPDAPQFKEKGPLLITHWGLSGPAVLKISAWAAREMMHADYKAKLTVNWLGLKNLEVANQFIKKIKADHLKSQVGNAHPTELANRFWIKLITKANIPQDKKWADVSNKELHDLSEILFATNFEVLGKNRYKDEFVECGGVDLKEINFKTMESKICPGLFFAGELLDIDGITGGFNFQNAWTGGWIAAQNI